MSKRIETVDATIRGGPWDGIRTPVELHDDGTARLVAGGVVSAVLLHGELGERATTGDYWFDSRNRELRFQGL